MRGMSLTTMTGPITRKGMVGQPGNKGQFAAAPHTESDVALRPTVRWVPDLDAPATVNTEFPQPQANDLQSVAAAVDAIALGANTPEAVAESLGMSQREGAYYADAAGYLGFVDVVPGQDMKTYDVTQSGQSLLSTTGEDRVELLRDTVAGMPGVVAYADGGDAAVLELMQDSGLGDTTAARRTSTIKAWYHSLAEDSEFSETVRRESSAARERAVPAAAAAEAARRLRAAARAPKQLAICVGCNMALPATGVCDFC